MYFLHHEGPVQGCYHKGDRHCHFLNWIVIVDVLGFVVLSRPGFLGCAHDSTCLRYWELQQFLTIDMDGKCIFIYIIRVISHPFYVFPVT